MLATMLLGLRPLEGPPLRRGRHLLGGHPIVRNFFADRCTHLAAMVAYYALLSLLPLLFLAFSLIGLAGRPDEGSFLIQQIQHVMPGQSVASIVTLARTLQRNSTELGVIGAVGLIWGALGFLSALESALNIVYDVPNRRFVRQKLMIFSFVGAGLVAMLLSLVVATTAHAFFEQHGSGIFAVNVGRFVLALIGSAAVTFGFLLVVYRYLPNTPVSVREVLPGTVLAAILMQASFQVLPLYLRYSGTLPALRVFGGAVVLLVWLFLMGNILLLGAEVNWWVGRGRPLAEAALAGEHQDEEGLGRS
jgi:membrane protein